MNISSLSCPRCNRKMEPMVNGGSLWLRCTNDAPRCGLIWPSETARAAAIEERTTVKAIVRDAPPRGPLEFDGIDEEAVLATNDF